MSSKIKLGGVRLLTDPYDKTPVASAEAYRRSYHNGKCDLAQLLANQPDVDEIEAVAPTTWALLKKWAETERQNRSNGTGTEGLTHLNRTTRDGLSRTTEAG